MGTARVLPKHLSQAVAVSPSRRIRLSCKSPISGNQRRIRPTLSIGRNARPVRRERASIKLDGVSVVSTGRSDASLTVERGVINIQLRATLPDGTTMMRLMASLDAPSSGCILADRKDVTGASVRERPVAIIHQQFMNCSSLMVFENIASLLSRAKLKDTKIQERRRGVWPAACGWAMASNHGGRA